jgi:hypothetical protein
LKSENRLFTPLTEKTLRVWMWYTVKDLLQRTCKSWSHFAVASVPVIDPCD